MKLCKYEPLGQYLQRKDENRITMTFEQIEGVLGSSLPDYFKQYPAGWYGTAEGSPTHKQKEAWQSHGYIVETVDLNKKEVTFIKQGEERQRKEKQYSSEPYYYTITKSFFDSGITMPPSRVDDFLFGEEIPLGEGRKMTVTLAGRDYESTLRYAPHTRAKDHHALRFNSELLKELQQNFVVGDRILIKPIARGRIEISKDESIIDINKMVVVALWIGKYNDERGGHELFNLTKNPIDGRFYGNCPETDNMPIQNFGAKSSDEYIDGITVVYATKKKNSSDYEIIAFAPDARVFAKGQSGAGLSRTFIDKIGKEETASYSVVSDTLYNFEDKANKFTIPKSKNKNPFRNQRIYADKHPVLMKDIANYIENILVGKEIMDDDIDEQDEIQRAEPTTQKEIEGSADRPLTIVNGAQGKKFGKDSKYSKAAIDMANYECQADGCKTFKNRKGNPYMEGHHLIPCTLTNAQYFKDKYNKNIDCVENIVCICPTCHRAIHFGDEPTRTEILKKLFTPKRAEALKKVGIPITLEELLKLYKKQQHKV